MKSNKIFTKFSLCLILISVTPVMGQWTKTNWPAANNFFDLYSSQNKVFVRAWDSLNGGRTFMTSDNGTTWSLIASADSGFDILSIILLNNGIFAGTWDGLFRSPVGEIKWSAVTSSGLTSGQTISALSMVNATLFCGTVGSTFKSSDNGNSWSELKSGIPANARIRSIVVSGATIFAGSDTNGVFVSVNDGSSWTLSNTGLIDRHIVQLAVMGTKVFAVTLKGVFVSNRGVSGWVASSSTLKNCNCLLVANDRIYAGTDSSGVYLSADSGETWTSFSTGLPAATRVWSMASTSEAIIAGTSNGIWRIQSSAGVKKSNNQFNNSKPKFSINNRTTVRIEYVFDRPQTAHVMLVDLNGKIVKSFVYKNSESGLQCILFDTKSVTPGSYILRLSVGPMVYQKCVIIQ
jgi:hypothetical protein